MKFKLGFDAKKGQSPETVSLKLFSVFFFAAAAYDLYSVYRDANKFVRCFSCVLFHCNIVCSIFYFILNCVLPLRVVPQNRKQI